MADLRKNQTSQKVARKSLADCEAMLADSQMKLDMVKASLNLTDSDTARIAWLFNQVKSDRENIKFWRSHIEFLKESEAHYHEQAE